MNGEKLLEIIADIDADLIEKAENPIPRKRTMIYLRYCAAAACICLVVIAAAMAFGRNHSKMPIDIAPAPPTTSVTEEAEPSPIATTPEATNDPVDYEPEVTDIFPIDDTPEPGINGLDYILTPSPNPAIYPSCQLMSSTPATGGPSCYDEYAEDTRNYGEAHSFVRLRILEVYSPEEAYSVTGEDIFLSSTTLFKAVITYNYLTDQPMDLEINLAQAGTAECQISGDPIYMPGDEYIVYLSNGDKGRYTAYMKFAVHEINGMELAYQIVNRHLKLESSYVTTHYNNLDLAMDESEKRVITSTSNNPVVYTYKMTVSDLVGFIREDWMNRGFVFKGFDQPDIDYSYIWHSQFKYHDVETTPLPEMEFAAQPYNWIGSNLYNYLDVKDELLADKNGLQLISYMILDQCSQDELIQYDIPADGTLYNVQIVKDCRSGEVISKQAKLWHYGNDLKQYTGYPVFENGEEFIAAVYQGNDGVLYPIYELEFLIAKSPIEDAVYAYHLGESARVDIIIDGYDLETGLGEIEAARKGSTENNHYWLCQKFIPEILEEFLRTHWVNTDDNTLDQADGSVDAEPMPAVFSTLDELIAAASGAELPTVSEEDKRVMDSVNITNISYLYVPTATFEGYKLFQIEVLHQMIFFYYVPVGSTPKTFSYTDGIIVTYARGDCLPYDYTVEELAKHKGTDLTEDGFLYEPNHNSITFTVGNSWMSIRVPDNMNDYELLKDFRKAERIIIK